MLKEEGVASCFQQPQQWVLSEFRLQHKEHGVPVVAVAAKVGVVEVLLLQLPLELEGLIPCAGLELGDLLRGPSHELQGLESGLGVLKLVAVHLHEALDRVEVTEELTATPTIAGLQAIWVVEGQQSDLRRPWASKRGVEVDGPGRLSRGRACGARRRPMPEVAARLAAVLALLPIPARVWAIWPQFQEVVRPASLSHSLWAYRCVKNWAPDLTHIATFAWCEFLQVNKTPLCT